MGSVDEWNYSFSPRGPGAIRGFFALVVTFVASLVPFAVFLDGDVVADAAPVSSVVAGRLALGDERGVWMLGDVAEMLIDDDGRWTIDDVSAPTAGWQPIGAPRYARKLGRGVLWLRLVVQDTRAPTSPVADPGWRVEFDHPRPIELTAWVPDRGRIVQKRGGLVTPLAEREVVSRAVVVPFSLSPGEAQTLYFRLDTAPLGFSAVIASSSSSASRALREERLLGLYYGGAAALFLYNLFLLVALRDPTYGWYLVFLVATVQFFLGRNGYVWLAGWTAGRGAGGGAVVALEVVVLANFTRALLGTREGWPRGDRVLRAVVVAGVVVCVASLLLPSRLSEAVLAPLGLLAVIASLAAGGIRVAQGSVVARYFLVAWGAFLTGGVLYVVKSTGLVPHNAFTEHAMQVGSALEMVLLSLALAHRVRSLDRLVREREHGLALARLEHARAVDGVRADAAARIVAAHEELGQRFARDLHDSVGHRFLLIEYAAQDRDDDESRAAIVALAREGAAETREIAHGLYPQRLLDVGLAGALAAAASGIERAGLRIAVAVDDDAVARLTPAARLTVLRIAEEALQNALRHAQATAVSLTLSVDAAGAGAVVLGVIDDGVGVGVGVGVDRARPTGLGMQTMHDRALQVGGALVIEDATPRGTAVRLRIPA
jgi:signal transduction histidine kinase